MSLFPTSKFIFCGHGFSILGQNTRPLVFEFNSVNFYAELGYKLNNPTTYRGYSNFTELIPSICNDRIQPMRRHHNNTLERIPQSELSIFPNDGLILLHKMGFRFKESDIDDENHAYNSGLWFCNSDTGIFRQLLNLNDMLLFINSQDDPSRFAIGYSHIFDMIRNQIQNIPELIGVDTQNISIEFFTCRSYTGNKKLGEQTPFIINRNNPRILNGGEYVNNISSINEDSIIYIDKHKSIAQVSEKIFIKFNMSNYNDNIKPRKLNSKSKNKKSKNKKSKNKKSKNKTSKNKKSTNKNSTNKKSKNKN